MELSSGLPAPASLEIESAFMPSNGGPAEPAPLVEAIRLLISGGGEILSYRGIAANVIYRLNQLISVELHAPFTFGHFDYTIDSSRDEEVGHVPDRSIAAVDDSEGVIAIVSDAVPEITRLEIRRVYELRRLGRPRELWFFVVPPSATGAGMPLQEFLEEIKHDFEKERIYHRVSDPLDFQASLFIELMPFVVRRTGSAFGGTTAGGRRS